MSSKRPKIIDAKHPASVAVADAISEMMDATRSPVERLVAATGMTRAEALTTICTVLMGHTLAAHGWQGMPKAGRDRALDDFRKAVEFHADAVVEARRRREGSHPSH